MSGASLGRPIVIWGAGAVGGTVGAHLVRAGHDVLFVDEAADHVAAMNHDGLAIEGPLAAFKVPVRAMTPDAVNGPLAAVFLCTKAQATEAAAREIAGRLAPDGFVLSLQNGLNERTIAATVGPERTVGAFVNFGADWLGPGRIHYGGRGAVVVGEIDRRRTPRVEAIQRLLLAFDPDAIVAEDIWGYLWGKLGYGALLFATALTNDSIADVLAMERYRPMLAALAREMTAAADAAGAEPLGFNGYDPAAFRPGAPAGRIAASFDAMVAHNRKSAKTHSGIWRDLAVRKRRTEVDPQLTLPLAEGEAAGIPMPLTRRLVALVHDVEEGRRPLALETLDALAATFEEATP